MQISQKRLRPNRANAARFVNPEGKAAHATRQTLLAKQILIGNESADNFKARCDILLQRFAPVDDFEYGLIEELAAAYWRLRRAWALETEMLENAMQKQSARRQLARMDAAFAEPCPSSACYQRALHSLILIRQIAPPTKIYANEPKTPFLCNEFADETRRKPPQTPRKPPQIARIRPFRRQLPQPPTAPIPRGQIPTIPATPN